MQRETLKLNEGWATSVMVAAWNYDEQRYDLMHWTVVSDDPTPYPEAELLALTTLHEYDSRPF